MKNDNIIDDLLSDTSHVETPHSWLWWSFVTAVSAVAGNNYYVRAFKGTVTYRANLYVMLLGDSGLGKGFPINCSKLLVQSSHATRVIAGRSSIQAIVKELATARSRENGRVPFTDSRGFIVNGELSSAIIADVDSLAILTDLYDGNYNPEWTNMLKGDPSPEKLKNPYITALFGSSPAHFYDSIPQPNIEGGYIGRNLIVFEEKRSKNVDMFEANDEKTEVDNFKDYLIPKYLPHLEKIANSKGQLILTDQARELFNPWRRTWRSQQVHDKTGFLNRVPDHTVKVAMCLALSKYDFTGVIDVSEIQKAIEQVTNLVYANKKTTEGKGLDPSAAQTKLILDELIRAKDNQLFRKQLLTKGYGSYDAFTLDRIAETLLEMGWVTRERIVRGSETDWLFKLAGEPLINYQKYVEQQNQRFVKS